MRIKKVIDFIYFNLVLHMKTSRMTNLTENKNIEYSLTYNKFPLGLEKLYPTPILPFAVEMKFDLR